MHNIDIYNKAIKVINSCETKEHQKQTLKYCELALKQFKNYKYGEVDHDLYNSLKVEVESIKKDLGINAAQAPFGSAEAMRELANRKSEGVHAATLTYGQYKQQGGEISGITAIGSLFSGQR